MASESSRACVPLPDPGAPNRIKALGRLGNRSRGDGLLISDVANPYSR